MCSQNKTFINRSVNLSSFRFYCIKQKLWTHVIFSDSVFRNFADYVKLDIIIYKDNLNTVCFGENIDELFSFKYISSLAIGPGWKAAILKSATEFYIIVANMKGQGMVTDFYIGGSTNVGDPTKEFGFEDYLQDYLHRSGSVVYSVYHSFCSNFKQ